MRAGLSDIIPGLREETSEEQPRVDSIRRNIRMDANVEKKVGDLLDSVQAQLEKDFPDALLAHWARAMTNHVSKVSRKNIAKTAKKVGLEIEPMMHDRGLSPWVQNIVDENVGLIRSIPLKKLPVFKNSLVALITADATKDDIMNMIMKNFGMARSDARLIARDQVGKLNGKMNQYRQQSLGGTRYRWRGSRDQRERADHLRLEGKIFKWDSPPIVDRKSGRRGHPGEDYQCRCRAEMVIEDILD